MSHLNNIRSKSLQLEPNLHDDHTQRAETVVGDTKTIEAKATKENFEQLLQDINEVDK
jgi:hypothetical protein